MIKNIKHFSDKIKKLIDKYTEINENGCWIWTGGKHKFGYGKLYYNYNGEEFTLAAHRAAWIVFKGEIPNDLRLCHNCPGGDNPSCCNPEHLFIGTAKDNTRDMMRKKKVFDFVGEKNNSAILNETIVLEMRELKKQGMKIKEIAKKYNVKYFTCLDVINFRNWRHV